MAAFFLVLILGQQLAGACGFKSASLWMDKLCIHQTDMDEKAEQLEALPIFLTRSERMLMLWDDTYFERLWCSLEAEQVHFETLSPQP